MGWRRRKKKIISGLCRKRHNKIAGKYHTWYLVVMSLQHCSTEYRTPHQVPAPRRAFLVPWTYLSQLLNLTFAIFLYICFEDEFLSTRFQVSTSQLNIIPMTMETRCSKVIFPNYSKKKTAEDTLVPPLWGTRGKHVGFSRNCSRCCTRRNLRFHVENSPHVDQKTVHATISLRSRHRSNPRPTRFVSGKAGECRWRPRRYQVDPVSYTHLTLPTICSV